MRRYLYLFFLLLTACASEPAPPPSPLAPYDNAIATAEAAGNARQQAAAYYERGNFQLDRGNYRGAIVDYNRSLELNSRDARAHNNRALAYMGLNELQRALEDYTAAIRIDPGYTRAYKNRASLLEKLGDLPALAVDYEQLARLEPANRARYRYAQGSILHGLGDLVGARRAYDDAIAASSVQVDALYERALINLAEQRPDAAINDLNTALRLSPRAANAYLARGLAYSMGGDATRAAADFSRSLQLSPDDPDALLGRAAAYAALGDSSSARTDLDHLDQLQLSDATRLAAAQIRRSLPPANN